MGISEFTVHNVLRTYSRQERLGSTNRARSRARTSTGSSDTVSLSSAGRKIQWLGSLAAEIVERESPDLTQEEKANRVRNATRELLARHREEVSQEGLSPEAFGERLRSIYSG